MRRFACACVFALTAVLLCSAVVRADESADLARARELYEEGSRLENGKAFEQALAKFRASRALHAGSGNTKAAAHCLGMLDRWDEALELYEELLGRFGAELAAKEGDAAVEMVKLVMTEYRRKVGFIDISANVSGQVLIDGRHRGTLPLGAALYALPGEHLVRITKEGYASYEKTTKVVVRQTNSLDAKLEPLVNIGRLRVEVDPKGELAAGGTLWIDRSPVHGSLPWEGNLAPGPHVLFVSSGDIGSGLVRVDVVQSQLVSAKLDVHRLGALVRLPVEPLTAQISIDGIVVGRGDFEGRLPVGDHSVVVRQDGYKPASFTLRSTPDRAQTRRVELEVDPTHPVWPRRLRLRVEVVAAPLLATSLRSGVEVRAGGGPVYGGLFSARVSIELPIRLDVDVSGGYLVLARSVRRSFREEFLAGQAAVPVRYDIQDELRVYGPFAGIGMRKRLPFGGDRFDLRLGMGLSFGRLLARDFSSATATSTGVSMPATTENNNKPIVSDMLLLTPEVDARYRLGSVELRVGLGVVAQLFEGEPFILGETKVDGGCPDMMPTDVRCAPGAKLIDVDGERSFGRFVAWAPRLSIGAAF